MVPWPAVGALIGSLLGTFVAPLLQGKQKKNEERTKLRLTSVQRLNDLASELEVILLQDKAAGFDADWASRFMSVTTEVKAILPGANEAVKILYAVIFESDTDDRIDSVKFSKARAEAFEKLYRLVFE